jgi:hypothetical protein
MEKIVVGEDSTFPFTFWPAPNGAGILLKIRGNARYTDRELLILHSEAIDMIRALSSLVKIL